MVSSIITSVYDIDIAMWQNLHYGPLHSWPEWIGVFEEEVAPQSRYLLCEENGCPSKLLPIYLHGESHSYFTHNAPFLLAGGMLGNRDASAFANLYKHRCALITSPCAYRFAIAGSDESSCRLNHKDIEAIEDYLAHDGVNLWLFAFLENDSNGDVRVLCDAGYQAVPIAVRWGLPRHKWSNFDEWLQSMSKKRRDMIKSEMNAIRRDGINIERWGPKAIGDNMERFCGLFAAHMRRYGHDEAGQKMGSKLLPKMLSHFGDKLSANACMRGDDLFGYSIQIESADTLYGKGVSFDDRRSKSYFAATYYLPVRYALECGKEFDVAVSSDEVKKSRGMKPTVLYAYYKMLDRNSSIAHVIEKQARASISYLSSFLDTTATH